MSATTISGGAIWWTLREAGTVLFAGKTVWSMLERLWGFTTRRYINLRYLYHSLPVNDIRQGEIELSLFHAKIKSQLLNNLKYLIALIRLCVDVRRTTAQHATGRAPEDTDVVADRHSCLQVGRGPRTPSLRGRSAGLDPVDGHTVLSACVCLGHHMSPNSVATVPSTIWTSLETERNNISRSFFQEICKPTSCLIPPPRDTTRLRLTYFLIYFIHLFSFVRL